MDGHPGVDLGSSPYLNAQGAQCISPTPPTWQRSSSTVISTVSRLAVPGSFFEAASFGGKDVRILLKYGDRTGLEECSGYRRLPWGYFPAFPAGRD